MKRLLAVVTLAGAAALLTAPNAFGFESFDYMGHVRGQATESVGFDVGHTARGRRKVIDFTVIQIPYTCSDAPPGTTTVGWQFDQRMRIRSDRTFAGTGDWIELRLDPVGSVSGKLRRGGVAVGDFRLRGELAGPGTHCHTGRLEWRATKTPPPA